MESGGVTKVATFWFPIHNSRIPKLRYSEDREKLTVPLGLWRRGGDRLS